MKFQPGDSGNPAARPPGSLNKKTLAADALLAEHAEEIAQNMINRANNGEPTAMRLCMDRLAPTGRNRRVAMALPVVKTPEDAEAALTAVFAEFAAGKLTIEEFSALMTAVERMVRVAERIWNYARARLFAEVDDAIALDERRQAANTAAQPARSAEEPTAPLYSPVNSGIAAAADVRAAPRGPASDASRHATPEPLAKAA